MNVKDINVLVDFYKRAPRQGPGSEHTTKLALSFLDHVGKKYNLLDIGCGSGKQTIHLAKSLRGRITALDYYGGFLKEFSSKLTDKSFCSEITLLQGSMFNIPFRDEEFDIIWAEGSIYIMGFAQGIIEWSRLIKPGGYLVVTDISWLTKSRPQEIVEFWKNNHVEIDGIPDKLKIIEENNYSCLAHFILPEECWIENYYEPLLNSSEEFLKKHSYSDDAKAVVQENKEEMELYKKYKEFYGYVFYIMRKL